MKYIISTTAALAATTTLATAGGIDRSGQNIGVIFEEGGETGAYAEFSYGSISPDVSGIGAGTSVTAATPTPGQASGDMADDYSLIGLGYKRDFGNGLSAALIYDQPFGANVNYPAGTTYYATGSTAELNSDAITGLVRYEFDENLSVHGGLRYQSLEMVASIPFVGGYTGKGDKEYGIGYVLGGAYEIPDIAMRVALTYSSTIEYDIATTETGGAAPGTSITTVETPQSINLDFQTGVAADTLLFGSARWVEWSEFDITAANYFTTTSGGSLVSYEDDRINYTLGLGRRFSETWSGAVSLGYESSTGGFSSNLGPTDGNTSIGVGGTYTSGQIEVTGGVRYIMIGDAQTTLDGGTTAANFEDNDGVALGIKVGYNY